MNPVRHSALLPTLLAAIALLAPATLGDDRPPMRQAEDAVLGYLDAPSSTAPAFLERWIAPTTIEQAGRDAALAALEAIYTRLHGAEAMDLMVDAQGVLSMEMAAPGHRPGWLRCVIEDEAPHRITNLWIEGGPALLRTEQTAAPEPNEPLTWDSLQRRLDREAAGGFTGVIRLVHDGEVVVDRGFGMANRERQIPCRPGTVFAIGSAPIDFTLCGILMLEQEGKLSFDDPITKYFSNVPPDKRAITIEHLMTGASGLQNFHDIPSDRDPDHAYIDRDEAMRRIFSSRLLFEPGTAREHSHSAWGVLAAIIEIVSGQTYPEFTRQRLFEPLGMTSTGFHGDAIPEGRLAIGYGERSDGEINSPAHWGRTSWLVMGSGGQVSTAGDMGRFIESIHDGALLNEENTRRFMRFSRGLLNGGNDYGFEIYYTYTPGTYLVMLCNAVNGSNRREVGELARDLGDLVLAGSAPKFTMGVGLAPGEGRMTVMSVAPGSGAEAAGLREGDALVGVGGEGFGDDPMESLTLWLNRGEPIPLDVERDGKRLRITVTPRPRN